MIGTHRIIDRTVRLERTEGALFAYRERSRSMPDPDRPGEEKTVVSWVLTDKVAWSEIAKVELLDSTFELTKADGGRLASVNLSLDHREDLWTWLGEVRPDLRASSRPMTAREAAGPPAHLAVFTGIVAGLLYLFVAWGATWDVSPNAWLDFFASGADEVGGNGRGSRRARWWLFLVGIGAWLVGWVARLIGWACELVTPTGVLVLGSLLVASIVFLMIARLVLRPTVRVLSAEPDASPTVSAAAALPDPS